MSDDPYFEVKTDELQWAISELKATLAAIEPDIDELEDSVAAVEEPGVLRRLGITDKEVKARTDFVQRAKGEVAAIRRRLPVTTLISPDRTLNRLSATSSAYPPSYHTRNPLDISDDDGREEESDPNAEFEVQHQTLLVQQQDRTLTDISGTVGLLRQQAQVMGREVLEQNAMLEDLDDRAERTGSRLAKAHRKMDRFVKDQVDSPSSWAAFLLIIVLCILLFVILFV
ncbi:hypothetical protein JCM11641_003811 [Rhodosporidiobolus odoratus]